MAPGPIPFLAIVQYARVFKIEEFEEFHYLIRRMDDAFLSNALKKAQKEKPNATNRATPYPNKV
jgi:hypothetical protein